MKESTNPSAIYLKDYKKPDYQITDIHLTFSLSDNATQVRSEMKIKRIAEGVDLPLCLNGEELKFKSATLNGRRLENYEYQLEKEFLIIKQCPTAFTLVVENEINPQGNKALDGLYKSGNIFCTQNEPEGFRRITYYIDRPDNMARFATRIIADKERYPVLLSNGNPVASGDLESGRHFVEWQDPFPKPSYLYALVAGDLDMVRDSFITMSGRKIDLRIYCDKGNGPKCQHAMISLKKAMK